MALLGQRLAAISKSISSLGACPRADVSYVRHTRMYKRKRCRKNRLLRVLEASVEPLRKGAR